jgi:hypothetical protein
MQVKSSKSSREKTMAGLMLSRLRPSCIWGRSRRRQADCQCIVGFHGRVGDITMIHHGTSAQCHCRLEAESLEPLPRASEKIRFRTDES